MLMERTPNNTNTRTEWVYTSQRQLAVQKKKTNKTNWRVQLLSEQFHIYSKSPSNLLARNNYTHIRDDFLHGIFFFLFFSKSTFSASPCNNSAIRIFSFDGMTKECELPKPAVIRKWMESLLERRKVHRKKLPRSPIWLNLMHYDQHVSFYCFLSSPLPFHRQPIQYTDFNDYVVIHPTKNCNRDVFIPNGEEWKKKNKSCIWNDVYIRHTSLIHN